MLLKSDDHPAIASLRVIDDPAAILFDGIVSCLRIYTPDEMAAMAREVEDTGYDWQAGVEYPAGSPIPIPYLIGVPRHPAEDTA
jgi:hypothetical protein